MLLQLLQWLLFLWHFFIYNDFNYKRCCEKYKIEVQEIEKKNYTL